MDGKIKNVQLELLDEFKRVCDKHNIKWFLDGGTLLGAVRGGGYIPWDDDIDVVLIREEYDKLCDVAKEFCSPFFFQTDKTDPGSMRGHAQLRMKGTKAWLRGEMIGDAPCFEFEQGIFIDLFVLDRLPDDKSIRVSFQRNISMLRKRAIARRNERAYWKKRKDPGLRLAKIPWWRLMLGALWSALGRVGVDVPRILFRRFEKTIRMYSDREKGAMCAPIGFLPEREEDKLLPFEIYEDQSTSLKFEGRDLPVPARFEEVLEKVYGSDWRIPRKSPSCHGEVIFWVE